MRSSQKTTIADRVEYAALRTMVLLACLLPRGAVYRLFDGLSILSYTLLKKRRNLAQENLRKAFPLKRKEEIERLAKESFRSIAATFAETILMEAGKILPEELLCSKKEADELAARLRVWEQEGRGVILIAAHFGNWEIGAQLFARMGLPVLVVGREGNNPLVEERFTRPMRERFGNRAVGKKRAAVAMMKRLKQGGRIGLLIDQKTGKKDRVMVEFFSQHAEMTAAVAHLKLKLDPAIVPVFFIRKSRGCYALIWEEAIETVCAKEESQEECLRRMSQSYSDAMEKMIRRYPGQWMWMHNRWRR